MTEAKEEDGLVKFITFFINHLIRNGTIVASF
jgi:hypothetical protein